MRALVHQRDAVGERDRLDLIVGDDQRRRADRAQDVAQLDAQRLAQLGIEIGQRLVEQQQLGRDRECARQRDALLLPAAQRHRAPIVESFEPDKAQQLGAAASLLGARHAALRMP